MGILQKLLGITPKKPPLHIDDSNFATEVLQSSVPVLLDVWGPNCRYCKQLEPVVMQLAAEYDGRVKVCELNAQDAPKSAARLKVKGVPLVVYYRPRGREVERISGMRSSLYHQEAIEELFEIPLRPEA